MFDSKSLIDTYIMNIQMIYNIKLFDYCVLSIFNSNMDRTQHGPGWPSHRNLTFQSQGGLYNFKLKIQITKSLAFFFGPHLVEKQWQAGAKKTKKHDLVWPRKGQQKKALLFKPTEAMSNMRWTLIFLLTLNWSSAQQQNAQCHRWWPQDT